MGQWEKLPGKFREGFFAAGAAGGRKLLCSVFAGFSAKTFPGFDYLTEFKSNQVRFID
jgi:hypothetical protein